MIILHIAAMSFNQSSGITYAVPPLISSQNKLKDVEAALLLTSDVDISKLDFDFPIYKYNERYLNKDLTGLPKPFDNPDIIIFHSTYIPKHMIIASHINKRKIPYIIVPHGGMTNTAQKKKYFKKLLANLLFYRNFVRNSKALHCLSDGEAEATKNWGRTIFVVNNGINFPEKLNLDNKGENNGIKFTFIGRLDLYHKGLDLLLEGITLSSDEIIRANAEFHIYGPDDNGSKMTIQHIINNNGLKDVVFLHEPIYGEMKKQVLQSTNVFVLTSRSEGHPISVLEALSSGIPCLLTPETNMSKEVLKAEAGWEVNLTANSISEGIERAIKEKDYYKQKAINAKKLAEEEYSWNKMAIQAIQNYRKILMQSSRIDML